MRTTVNCNCEFQSAFIKLHNMLNHKLNIVNSTMLGAAQSDITKSLPEIGEYLGNSSGKRLRPILTLACANLLKYEGEFDIYLAVAVELIHTATLLHDDVVDGSNTRRGVASINHIWGNKASILTGDYLFSVAFEFMVKTSNIDALSTLAYASHVISESELWQLELVGNITLYENTYVRLARGKTAELFAAACKSGAIIATDDKEIIENFYEFGINLGIVFQIMDDWLDYSGDKKNMGKETMQDILEQKVTLPLILLYQLTSDDEKNIIHHCFSNKHVDEANYQKIQLYIAKYNIHGKVLDIAQKYVSKATENLDSIRHKLDEARTPYDDKLLDTLITLTNLSIERKF